MNTVFSCVDLYGQSCVYACLHVQLWEYIHSLVTGWTWGHGIAAALSPLGCQLQQPLNYFFCKFEDVEIIDTQDLNLEPNLQ